MSKRLLLFILSLQGLCLLCIASADTYQDSISSTGQLSMLLDRIKNEKQGCGISIELNQVLSIYEDNYTAQSPQYAECLMWCAYICAEYGDYLQAKHLLSHSTRLFHNYGNGIFEGRDTINEMFRLDLEAKLEYDSGREFRAVGLMERSCELKRTYFGESSEVYLSAVLNISFLCAQRLNLRKSNKYHNAGYTAYVERIKREFCATSESERAMYWETASKYIDKTLSIAHQSGEGSNIGGMNSLASAAYNAMLLSKGLLLNTTISFEEYVIKTGIEEAVKCLKQKKLLSSLQCSQDTLDSIDYEILKILEKNNESFKLPHLSIGWKDVAESLESDDLAIEFYKIRGEYGALLLKKGWNSPKLMKLEDMVSVDSSFMSLDNAMNRVTITNNTSLQHDNLWHLSQSIWTDDIVKHFPRTSDGRIFFSADGELLVTGIEYLPFVSPNLDGNYYCVADLFNIYRLSSTRELRRERADMDNMSMAIYGGLYYDMQFEDLVADSYSYMYNKNNVGIKRKDNTLYAARGADAIGYLEGTKREVESVVSTINDICPNKYSVTTYVEEAGTEASFKALSGLPYKIIHIATHGYFYEENDSTFNRFGLGKHPLVRSGLFLAGADNKWFGDNIPQGVDDGFLTALEISNLNFRGLDLVVLSACETAKGDVRGDGVFGLQRGFKMAGAESVLMSLWKVDDEATSFLMSRFYKYWMSGKEKQYALNCAIGDVRACKEKGWDNPMFWAAFILLDGLD